MISGRRFPGVGEDSVLLRSAILGAVPGFAFGMSTRRGGVGGSPFGMNLSYRVGDREENVVRNFECFTHELGITPDQLAIPSQVHGTLVRMVREPGRLDSCDGLMTDRKGLFLCVTVADCVPLFLVEPRRQAVAAVHAGWRGTASGIVRLAVESLKREYGIRSENLLAFVGPSARSCCYAVGDEVASRFPGDCVREAEGKVFLDLLKANVSQLQTAGVSARSVEVSPYCTICNPELFHSFRRDGSRSGRMMAAGGFLG
jgi:YfiH family protein